MSGKSWGKLVLGISFSFILLKCSTLPRKSEEMQSNKPAMAEKGMVVSANSLSSQAGIEVLKMGGNAIDAAVAVHFTLAVSYQRAGNLAGGGFAVIRLKNGEVLCLDFREVAPALAHKDMFLNSKGEVIEGKSREGLLAAGVPASVAGIYEMHQKYGKVAWKELMKKPIQLAEKGFALSKREAEGFNEWQKDFRKFNSQVIPQTQKERWKEGELFVQKELAKTLKIIAEKGADGFYKGEIADWICEQMAQEGGIIQKKDLENYRPIWRQPLVGQYKDYQLFTVPPPSSGGLALLQLFKLVEKYPIADWGPRDPRTVHLMVEAEKRAFADRATYLGDPAFVQVPVEKLLSDKYLQDRMKQFSFDSACPSSQIKAGEVKAVESTETTHFSIVDSEGNAVSLTTTLNSNYGCKTLIYKGGFWMNNIMDDFSIKPGVANQFGLVGDTANAIAPHKKMLSSMCPVIIEKNGKPYLLLGTPGGSTIITSIFQVIINCIDFGMPLQEAVNYRRFHHQWLPDRILHEKNAFSDSLMLQLKALGHTFEERKEDIGAIEAIMIQAQQLLGAADSSRRIDDRAIGF